MLQQPSLIPAHNLAPYKTSSVVKQKTVSRECKDCHLKTEMWGHSSFSPPFSPPWEEFGWLEEGKKKKSFCIAQYQTYSRNHIYVQQLVSLAGFVRVLYWAASSFLYFWCVGFFSPPVPSVLYYDSRELLFHDTSNQREQVVSVHYYSRQRYRPQSSGDLRA